MRYKPGQSGNPAGKPKGSKNHAITLEKLTAAIRAVEKSKRKSLLEHFVERSYKDNKLLAVLMKKYIADKKELVAEVKAACIEDVLRDLKKKS
jgi:hypothetical protein